MIQRSQYLGFALKPDEPIRVPGQSFGEHLDGYQPIQLGVTRFVNLTHAARADGRNNFVGAESIASGERHMKE